MTDELSLWESDLSEAIRQIQQPRTDFQLKHFVIGQHDTEPRRWMQCVLELQTKLQVLKRFGIERRRMLRKILRLKTGDLDQQDEAALLEIGVEELNLAALGAMREAGALYSIFKSFPRSYTRDELNAAEEEYWQKRLTRQARQEINATGAIGVGNQDALEQVGISPGPLLAEARQCLKMLHQESSNGFSISPPQLPDTPPADFRT